MHEIYIAITLTDGMCIHMAFQTRGRGFHGGAHLGWITAADGWFVRLASAANIEAEVRDMERKQWNVERRDKRGNVEPARQVVSWRRLTQAEHLMFEEDRPGEGSVYRNALVDRNGRIEYDMDKARECHRRQMRRQRAAKMVELDAQWMRASGQKRAAGEVDAIEVQRQKWRDAPADPRIDAAQTIEELKQLTRGQ